MIQDLNNPIREFAYQMMAQLEKHNEEKTIKFIDMNAEQCKKLLEQEFLKRIQIINNTDEKNIIAKQAIHLANYAYFLWSRCK